MEHCLLKELANINAGYPFRGKVPEASAGEIVVVQMKDISPQGDIQWQSCIRTELENKREPDGLCPGDILVAARGNRNYAVLVDENGPKSTALAAPHFYVARIKRQDVLPEFVVWWLNQGQSQRYFEQSAEGTLTKSIRRTVLEEVPVALPDLATQKSIVALARTIAKERQTAEQLIANGERILAAVASDLASTKTH
ncbi:MAG TPA: restriction endonuclease subunit S [Scandinavium sp.]|uniref:restriction endonuclease subunit S n=1 Tax=Scandinavium sp. TaxID=2830653 RepID=UPI002E2EB3EC|nr:restriction endonuclease subunit S [Scandinavium sp.]HEX4500708.1 restriction endonuclease subunit S [Scandinavium sp.]